MLLKMDIEPHFKCLSLCEGLPLVLYAKIKSYNPPYIKNNVKFILKNSLPLAEKNVSFLISEGFFFGHTMKFPPLSH